MNKKFLYTTAIIVTSLFLLAGCDKSDSIDSSKISSTNSGKIMPLQELSHDWGDINIKGGTVEKTFKFKNEGDEDLVLISAFTSCMCTSAEIKLADGTLSPLFGMPGHGGGGTNWNGIVKPEEEFEMKVVFDPMAHGPNGTGPIARSIFLTTSSVPNGNYAKTDPKTGSMMTEIKAGGNVLSEDDFEKKKSLTPFLLEETEFDFGVIKQSGAIVSHDFEFEYQGDAPVTVTSIPTSCACTSAEISPKSFEKGDKGVLTVNFDPNLHEEPEGKFFKTVSLLTDPKLEQQPEVKIWVEVDLDLGPESFKLKEAHDDDLILNQSDIGLD